MGEHIATHLVGGEVPLLREGERGEQLGDVGADHVGAEDLVELGVGDDLDEADGLAEALGLAVGGERERGRLDVVAFSLACASE